MEFAKASDRDIASAELKYLVSLSMYEPSDEKIVGFFARFGPESTFVARDGGAIAGQITVTRNDRSAVIRSVAAHPRRRGVGRFLVTSYIGAHPGTALEAETDSGAVGFYRALGFRVESLGERYPGTVRYRCVYDDGCFDPLSCADAAAALLGAGIRCWVAGGWALDLFRGWQSRPHEDTDVAVLRTDQAKLFRAFPGWEIYRTHAPGLSLWNGVPFLETVPNVWLRRSEASAWNLEAMFVDVEDGQWVYRRNRAIRGPLDSLGLVNREGIPYIRPEIQLLYKGGSSRVRDKDTEDLASILPILPDGSKRWLEAALSAQFPEGHPWLRIILDSSGE